MPPYPCCVVDPEYPADDVLLQVGRDKLHLDGSVAVDSVFWPVLWAQLNKIGTYIHTHAHTHTHTYTHTHTHTCIEAGTPAHTQIDKTKKNTQGKQRT